MATKYLDSNGLLYLWQKIRNTFVSDVTWDSTNRKLVKKKKTGTNGAEQSTDLVTFATVATSGSYTDLSDKPTIPAAVQPTTTTPKMDGTAAVGSETKYAKGDHVHPSDTSRVPTTRKVNGHALSSDVTVTASDVGLGNVVDGANMVFDRAESFMEGVQLYVMAGDTQDTYAIPDVLSISEAMTAIQTAFDTKVDKVSGKGLSTNDFTTTLKDKLDGIAAGAEVNVNADWNATSGDAQILNKPTLGAAAAKGVVTTISADSANLPTATAVKNYVATAITGATAFQGTAPTNFAPTNYKAGYYWVVGTAGTYAGQTCEAGDMIFATADGTTYSADNFDVIQTNLDIASITNSEIDTIVAA